MKHPAETIRETLIRSANERITNCVIFLVGVIVILIAVFISKGNTGKTILFSVGTSLIASSVVSYLSSFYLIRHQQTKEIIESWGLCSICDTRAEMNKEIGLRLDNASKELDVIAYGLKSLRETKAGVLKEKLANGMKIRLITASPCLELLNQKDRDENKLEGSTSRSIKDLIEFVKKLQPAGDIEIRVIDTLPTELYFREDNYLYVGPYQIGRESQRAITTEYRGPSKGFQYYIDYFELLWSAAHSFMDSSDA